jgi:hypothetical protein
MENLQLLPVILSSSDGRRQEGSLRLRIWSPQEKRHRAIRVWCILWGLMIGAVFIPLVHFFLVPALLVGGPVAAWFMSRVPNEVTGGEARCPACGAGFQFARSALRKWPLRDVCGSCHAEVAVSQP